MKKTLLFAAALFSASTAFAGGYLTNTNQSAAFVRNPARLATFDLDGAYSNPAGLAWIGQGLHIGFSWQGATQELDITSTYAPFAFNSGQLGNKTRKFNGNAKAPFIPSLDIAYQHKDWTVSAHVGVVGGGGKCTFRSGLPMFESSVADAFVGSNTAIAGITQLQTALSPFGMSLPNSAQATGYSVDADVQGEQYLYGVQIGATYKIFENLGSAKHGLSVHLGARASIASNSYSGYMKNWNANFADGTQKPLNQYMTEVSGNAQVAGATASQVAQNPILSAEQVAMLNGAGAQLSGASTQLAEGATALSRDIELNCEQSGWGIAPIVGLDYRVGKLNIGARYEFKTNISVENKTSINTTGAASFDDGVKVDNDIPAILAIGAQYEILKNWRVMGGWNMYFDKQAEMSGGKEAHLDHNTMEFQFGTEYDIKNWTVSLGYQNTNYGMLDGFQSDLAFSCDSHMLNVGLRYNINKHLSVDAGYMRSFYDDYTKKVSDSRTDVYSRENQTFGLGVTWHM